jgi:hypothetical protein
MNPVSIAKHVLRGLVLSPRVMTKATLVSLSNLGDGLSVGVCFASDSGVSEDLALGGTTAAKAREYAASSLRDAARQGATTKHTGLEKFASAGNHGAIPNNVHRDTQRLFQRTRTAYGFELDRSLPVVVHCRSNFAWRLERFGVSCFVLMCHMLCEHGLWFCVVCKCVLRVMCLQCRQTLCKCNAVMNLTQQRKPTCSRSPSRRRGGMG